MDLVAQDSKHCEDCRHYEPVKGDSGICGALYYDLSMGSHEACECFEPKLEGEK